MKRKISDIFFHLATAFCAFFATIILCYIVGFLVSNGFSALTAQHGLSERLALTPERLWQMIVSTLILVGLTLSFVLPIAISAAIYLYEYATDRPFAQLVRFCVQTLASIPSIIYGLFGMLIFVRLLGLGVSLLSGALTLTLMLMPLMMTQTENALRQIPNSYREASASLGATPFETMVKTILPQALPGIFVGVFLTMGRILSESAALLFTIGGFVRMPVNPQTGWISVFERGTTLTIRALIEFKEYGNLEGAAAIGIITVGVVIGLNLLSKGVVWIFTKD